MKPLSLTHLIAIPVLMTGLLAPARAELIIAEKFTDNERSNQTPPESLAWHASAGSSSIGMANNTLTIASAGRGANSAVAYFPAAELSEGKSVKLSLKFKPTVIFAGSTLYSMLVGLFDSNGESPVTEDGEDPSPLGSLGYAIALNYNEHPQKNAVGGYYLRVLKRTLGGSSLITTTKAYEIIANRQNNPTPVKLATGQVYDFELTLTKVSDVEYEIEATVSGGDLNEPITIRAIDTTSQLSKIDTIALTSFEEKKEGSGGFADTGFSDIRLEVNGQ